MKQTGRVWLIFLVVYAAFTLGCAVAAVVFPAWAIRAEAFWRFGTAAAWLGLAVARVVYLAAVLLFKTKGKG